MVLNDRAFRLELAPGTYVLTADHRGYLPAQSAPVTVLSGQTVRMPAVKLVAGDANDDGAINIADAALVAGAFNRSDLAQGDLNGDGIVNILDLVLVNSNFGKSGLQTW